MAPAPPATAFDAANLPRWYHERPGVTKVLADHAHSAAAAAAAPSAAPAGVPAAGASASPLASARKRVRGAEAAEAGVGVEVEVEAEVEAACAAQLARAVEAFSHVLSESLVEAVLRSQEMQSDEMRSEEMRPEEMQSEEMESDVFASLTPLLRDLAADLLRVGGAAPATWRAVGQLAQSAREIGMRCFAYDSPEVNPEAAASPESWTRGLSGWLEACDGLVESVLGRELQHQAS